MKLSAPKQGTYCIACVLFVIGLIGHFVPTIPFLSAYHEWLVIISNILLFVGCAIKGF